MDEMDFTRKFRLGDQRDLEIKAILTTVYQALQEKGYNPSQSDRGLYPLRRIPPISPTTITPGR